MNTTERATDRIQTVTGSTFTSTVLEGRGPIVVEFMSYGCSHCRAIEPVMQSVATTEGDETFYRVNVALEPGLVNDYAIEGTPTLLMFLDAKEVGRVVGPHPSLPGLIAAVTKPFAR